MSETNAPQIAEWNGALGQRWAALQDETDRLAAPFGEAALDLAVPLPGERVIDIGCGCGTTTIELARRVGPSGEVLGVDVSQPMLEVARSRGAPAASLAPLTFCEADAADAELPAGRDLLFSRFGVMFFAEPVPALRHLRQALRPGGRFVFVCWRPPRDNGWAMAPLVAARKALGVTPEKSDPHAPGPFAFADDTRLRGLLADAGFDGVEVRRFDTLVPVGGSPRAAAEAASRLGPTSRLLRDIGEEHRPTVVAAVEAALAPLAAADGSVSLSASTWLVQALNP